MGSAEAAPKSSGLLAKPLSGCSAAYSSYAWKIVRSGSEYRLSILRFPLCTVQNMAIPDTTRAMAEGNRLDGILIPELEPLFTLTSQVRVQPSKDRRVFPNLATDIGQLEMPEFFRSRLPTVDSS